MNTRQLKLEIAKQSIAVNSARTWFLANSIGPYMAGIVITIGVAYRADVIWVGLAILAAFMLQNKRLYDRLRLAEDKLLQLQEQLINQI